jgi:hypothetical protein
VLLALPGGAQAADKEPGGEKAAGKGPVGLYKFVALLPNQEVTLFLVNMDNKGGKWSVSTPGTSPNTRIRPTGVENATVTGDRVSFDLKILFQNPMGNTTETWGIEGKVPKEKAKAILGSIRQANGQFLILRLEPTKLQKLDNISMAKETLANQHDFKGCDAALTLLTQAKAQKATAAEIKSWANKAVTLAEPYGPRYQSFIARNVAQVLDRQEIEPTIALEYAQKLEKLMDDKEPTANQIRTLEFIVSLLEKGKKTKEVKEYRARIARLRSRSGDDELKKALTFKPEPFAGRKGKSTRAVLVESFTGAQCEACPATDIALHGIGKSYKPADVVVLQYHVNFPGPDPLANAADKARFKYYFDQAEGTPVVFFNGKVGAPGGGPALDAEDKYREFRDIIDPLLEKSTNVKLKASAERKGDEIVIKTEVSGLAKPGENLRLRLALVESWVKYTGKNKQNFHLYVVRDMPGGPAGMALVKKTNKQSVTVDLEKLRTKLNTYLDNHAKHHPFLDEQRPLDFKNLYVVAFVQNDTAKTVLQAVQVKVTGKEPKEKEETEEGKDEKKETKQEKKRKKKTQDD